MSDINSAQARMAGSGATKVVNDTDSLTVDFSSIQITASTVVAVLELNGSDVLSDYFTTSANGVTSGVITCPIGKKFTKIQLTSGEVIIGLL